MVSKKEIEYVINETFGPEALPIAFYLINKENISEFVIAKDLNIEIHRVRKIFYKLLEDNTVTFIRKKDKIKGWYICYWSLNTTEIPYIKRKIKKNKIEKLKIRLNQETTDDFFMCRNACTRMTFDDSFELNFKCPDCGEIMNQQDNKRTQEFLRERIAKLEKQTEMPLIRKKLEEPTEEPVLVTESTKVKKPKKTIKSKKKQIKQIKKLKTTEAKKTSKPKKVAKPKKPVKKVVSKKVSKAKKVAKPKKKKFSLFKHKKK